MIALRPSKLVAGALALVALAQPVAATAQDCVAQADLADGIIYAMPLITQAAKVKCNGALRADGYLAARGDELAARYTIHREASWPGARRMLAQFAGQGDPNVAAMLDMLPEESLRPFLDTVLIDKIGSEIDIAHCPRIERGIELLAPLPPQNTANLIAFLVSLTDVKTPAVCRARGE